MTENPGGEASAAHLVNLERYPLASLDTRSGAAFASACRSQYLGSGLCALEEFIAPGALAALADEANAIRGEAYFCRGTHNAWLTKADTNLPPGDVGRRQERTFAGSVAYDLIGQDALLRRLYAWDPLKQFIGVVLGKRTFHRFADPLGACSINVFVEGGEHGWHFDESEFTVTLMLQAPESGGAFEYVPRIRGLEDEREIVARVLDGDRACVEVLSFTPGTLLIFGGRQTLHRVTRVAGSRPRLVPVLCFSETPGRTNSDAVRKLFWGRTRARTGRAA